MLFRGLSLVLKKEKFILRQTVIEIHTSGRSESSNY